MENTYYYLLFDQKLFFEDETIEELLRERANYYFSKERAIDFWLLTSPQFVENDIYLKYLTTTNYYKNKVLNNKSSFANSSFVCLISTNVEFIKWIELRIGFFETYNESLENIKLNSNGIKGILKKEDSKIFNFNNQKIYPDLLLNRYKENLSLIYNNNK